jgi:hypothetical protein
MGKCLLSVDWDYFIYTKKENWGSYLENNKNVVSLWYKRFYQFKMQGRNLEEAFQLSNEVGNFWDRIRKKFKFSNDIKVYVSDSHALSYNIAKNKGCTSVYLFDAHADLGYGGLPSLNFELNCANWLGKLLQDRVVHEANIIYSPYSMERPEDFAEINKSFNVKYLVWDDIPDDIEISAIHICRSGAWTPPWFDEKFFKFVEETGVLVKNIGCSPRKWDIENINLSDQIAYMMA